MSGDEQILLACKQRTRVRSEHGYEQVIGISAVHSSTPMNPSCPPICPFHILPKTR